MTDNYKDITEEMKKLNIVDNPIDEITLSMYQVYLEFLQITTRNKDYKYDSKKEALKCFQEVLSKAYNSILEKIDMLDNTSKNLYEIIADSSYMYQRRNASYIGASCSVYEMISKDINTIQVTEVTDYPYRGFLYTLCMYGEDSPEFQSFISTMKNISILRDYIIHTLRISDWENKMRSILCSCYMALDENISDCVRYSFSKEDNTDYYIREFHLTKESVITALSFINSERFDLKEELTAAMFYIDDHDDNGDDY